MRSEEEIARPKTGIKGFFSGYGGFFMAVYKDLPSARIVGFHAAGLTILLGAIICLLVFFGAVASAGGASSFTKPKGKVEWEVYDGGSHFNIYRIETPEGWIAVISNGNTIHIPDANHEWKIDKKND